MSSRGSWQPVQRSGRNWAIPDGLHPFGLCLSFEGKPGLRENGCGKMIRAPFRGDTLRERTSVPRNVGGVYDPDAGSSEATLIRMYLCGFTGTSWIRTS